MKTREYGCSVSILPSILVVWYLFQHLKLQISLRFSQWFLLRNMKHFPNFKTDLWPFQTGLQVGEDKMLEHDIILFSVYLQFHCQGTFEIFLRIYKSITLKRVQTSFLPCPSTHIPWSKKKLFVYQFNYTDKHLSFSL